MKKWTIVGLVLGVILIGVAVLFTMCIGDCKATGGENFGDIPGENPAITAVGTVMLNPQRYLDKEVIVEGVIASECPTGGWINIRDNSGGTINFNMHGTTVGPIPQRVGSKVIAKGMVYQTEGTPKETKLLASGLRIPAFSCTRAHAHNTHDCTTSTLFSVCCCQHM